MKNINLLIFLFLFSTLSIFSQNFKVNLNNLTEQTQLSSESSDAMRMVWWIPVEFWETVFREDGSISEEEIIETIEIFKKHTIVGIVDGKIGVLGTVKYNTFEEIKQNTTIIDNLDNTYKPLNDNKIDEDTSMILEMMKPMLSSMLGNLGQNFHFLVFDNKNIEGNNLVEPTKKGTFTVKLRDELYTFRLPIGALLPDKQCSEDNEMLNGAWSYCPWHGNKLQ